MLNEKGLDWESPEVDLFNGEQVSADYLKINPMDVAPTLLVDDRPVVEWTLIVEFLDEMFPEPALKPADPTKAPRSAYSRRNATRGCIRA